MPLRAIILLILIKWRCDASQASLFPSYDAFSAALLVVDVCCGGIKHQRSRACVHTGLGSHACASSGVLIFLFSPKQLNATTTMAAPPESHKMPTLQKFAENVYIAEYPISFAGCRFNARMTVIRLSDGTLALHSPCDIDAALKNKIEELGQVSCIIAPGNYHYLHVPQCKETFPSAQVYLSPGLDKKQPKLLKLNGAKILNDDDALDTDVSHIFLSGNRIINEMVFYHSPSKTLVLTDSIEFIGDDTPDTNWVLRIWWYIMRMWNKPKPAPEYQMGWWCKNKQESRNCMEKILEWDFEQVIIAHGDNITGDECKNVVRQAWNGVLE